MNTPEFVFRGRRSSGARALVPAAVQVLPEPGAAREVAPTAVEDGADLVSFAGTGALVAWTREKFPQVEMAGDGTPAGLAVAALAASVAGTRPTAKAVRWE